MAVAHTLHYQMGIPVRKVLAVLETLIGLKLTQGAITQDALRWARGKVGIPTSSYAARYGNPQRCTPTTLAGGWAGRTLT
jgi:hypothetical protein